MSDRSTLVAWGVAPGRPPRWLDVRRHELVDSRLLAVPAAREQDVLPGDVDGSPTGDDRTRATDNRDGPRGPGDLDDRTVATNR